MPGKMNNGVPVEALGAPRSKKKVLKKQPKRGLRSYAKAVAKYLVSDTYMYAPLVDNGAADGCATAYTPPTATGVSRSPLSTETLQKISAKVSAKRVLYEEFVK